MIPALLVSLARAVARVLRRRRAVSLAPIALALGVFVGAMLGTAFLFRPRAAHVPVPVSATVAAPSIDAATIAPSSPGSPSSTPLDQLERALDEAHRNCEVARAHARGAVLLPLPLFRTIELEAALLDNPWVVDRALGEVDTLLRESAWLAELEPGSTLGGRTWEDVRFLLAGVHWYLERAWDAGARSEVALRASPALAGATAHAPLPEPRRHELVDDHDRAHMREFRDVPTFEDLLGLWD